jgi:hypothetical protein
VFGSPRGRSSPAGDYRFRFGAACWPHTHLSYRSLVSHFPDLLSLTSQPSSLWLDLPPALPPLEP